LGAGAATEAAVVLIDRGDKDDGAAGAAAGIADDE
jgi:hypothetical protein